MSEPINNLLSPDARRRLSNALMASQFDRPTPQDSAVTERAGMFPLATYANGQTGVAWPGFIAQPVESFVNLLQRGYQGGTGDTQGVEDAFNVAGAAMLGGIAAPRPRGSIGMGERPKDLNMSPEARKARAEAIGFDPSTVYYHATRATAPFDAFEIGRDTLNQNILGNPIPTQRHAIFVSADRAFVDRFADGGEGQAPLNIMPLFVRANKTFDATNGFADHGDTFFKRHGLDAEIYTLLDAKSAWQAFDGAEGKAFRDALIKDGYDSVKLIEDASPEMSASKFDDAILGLYVERHKGNRSAVLDEIRKDQAAATDPRQADVYQRLIEAVEKPRVKASAPVSMAILDPRNIRSVNAAFDPDKVKSANLLASNASVPAAGVVNALLQSYYGDRQR